MYKKRKSITAEIKHLSQNNNFVTKMVRRNINLNIFADS